MKRSIGLILKAAMLVFVVSGYTAMARPVEGEIVIKEWDRIGESADHIDVSAKILKCNAEAAAQIHIQLFNENPVEKTVNFQLTIKDIATGESVVKNISFVIAIAAIVQADCATTEFDSLKIDVPAGYDAANLELTIVFN